MDLNNILQASESCLKLLRDKQFDDLQIDNIEYSQALDEYLHSVDVLTLNVQQQSVLRRVNDNHQLVIDLVEQHKHQVGRQIAKLQMGQKLQMTYHHYE